MTLYTLAFVICTAAADPAINARACEEGEVTHRSCAFAEEYVRAGMRPGQTLFITECRAP